MILIQALRQKSGPTNRINLRNLRIKYVFNSFYYPQITQITQIKNQIILVRAPGRKKPD
jgi:hypothetical protein